MGASAGDLTGLTVTELLPLLQRRKVSPVEVVSAYLARIDAVNPSLNAIVTLCADEALQTARRLEQDFASRGEDPLYGVPFTVKDVIATAGVPTTCGSLLHRDHVPARDATAVARLRAAGGVLLGKTNCPEFAMDTQTRNRVFGHTRNPWDSRRTPGGSSGGESAAIAAGCSPLGVGTDFGGSLRWPAHCTGIAALRPTPGRVPSSGRLPSTSDFRPPPPNSMTMDGQLHVVGPLARCAEDLLLVTAVLAGPDGIDGLAAPVPFDPLSGPPLANLRCGWVTVEGSWPVRADLVQAVERAARELELAGAAVRQAPVPGLDDAESTYSDLRSLEGLAELRPIVAGREEELSPMVRRLLAGSEPARLDVVARVAGARDALRAAFLSHFEEQHVLLMPVACLPAFEVDAEEFEVDGVRVPYWQVLACCRAISLFAVPSAVVRCGCSREGLPVGVQVVGPPYAEGLVLRVAAYLEERLSGGAQRPPSLPQARSNCS